MRPGETMVIGHGSSGLQPLRFTSPFNLELGYLKLIVSTVEVAELISIQQPGLMLRVNNEQEHEDDLPPGGDHGDDGGLTKTGIRGLSTKKARPDTKAIGKDGPQPFWNSFTVSVRLEKEECRDATSLVL